MSRLVVILLLLLGLLGLAMSAETLKKQWRVERDIVKTAKLFATCTISADKSTINHLVCSIGGDNTILVGCLDIHTPYICDNTIGQWTAIKPQE